MKFEIQVGTDYSTVKFFHWNQTHVCLTQLEQFFKRLGGIYYPNPGNEPNTWKFPKHITSEVIQEVIHNTCFVCGGLMRDDYYEEIKGAIKFNTAIRKCTSCGHSHT